MKAKKIQIGDLVWEILEIINRLLKASVKYGLIAGRDIVGALREETD